MLEHITLLTYLYTRLGSLSLLLWFALLCSAVYGLSVLISYDYSRLQMGELRSKALWNEQYAGRAKTAVKVFFVISIVLALLPSKEDALLIVGVSAGATAATEVISELKDSEIPGKLFQIVTLKVDEALNEVKGK